MENHIQQRAQSILERFAAKVSKVQPGFIAEWSVKLGAAGIGAWLSTGSPGSEALTMGAATALTALTVGLGAKALASGFSAMRDSLQNQSPQSDARSKLASIGAALQSYRAEVAPSAKHQIRGPGM